MATTRLRRTFKYPDKDDEPMAMDEEEQDKLIEALKQQNAEQNFEYLRLFVALTVASAMFFIPIFYKTELYRPKLLAVMGIMSLALTMYMLVLIPNRGKGNGTKGKRLLKEESLHLSLLQRYIPSLNATLAAVVAVAGLEFKGSPRVHAGYWVICCVPLIMYGVTQLVRRFLVEVDLEGLEHMRYEYKGA